MNHDPLQPVIYCSITTRSECDSFFDSFTQNGNANVAKLGGKKKKSLPNVDPAHLCNIIHLYQGVDEFSRTAFLTMAQLQIAGLYQHSNTLSFL